MFKLQALIQRSCQQHLQATSIIQRVTRQTNIQRKNKLQRIIVELWFLQVFRAQGLAPLVCPKAFKPSLSMKMKAKSQITKRRDWLGTMWT